MNQLPKIIAGAVTATFIMVAGFNVITSQTRGILTSTTTTNQEAQVTEATRNSFIEELRQLLLELIAKYDFRKSKQITQKIQKAEGPENTAGQFLALEEELIGAKTKGSNLSKNHSNRIERDLQNLERRGHNINQINRLRSLLVELSPHLLDQNNNIEIPQGSNTAIDPNDSTNIAKEKSCTSNTDPLFTNDITDISRISQITPAGTIFAGNIIKSHSYIWIKDGGEVPVYAPTDAKLKAGSFYSEGDIGQYLLFFEVSCEVEFKFDHILNPVESIKSALPSTPKIEDSRTTYTEPIHFKAGDIIGYTSGTPQAHNWDFGVYNNARPDPDALVPGAEGRDKYANCPYDYYNEEKRSAYYQMFNENIGTKIGSIAYCEDGIKPPSIIVD